MRPVTLIAFAVLMPCSLVVSGCGSNGRTPQVASVSSVTTTTTLTTSQNGLLAFSDCMRSHGMPNFPDPQRFVGGNVKLTLHQLEPSSPQFHEAISACNYLLPAPGPNASLQTAEQERTQLADGLSFARCMRGHGVSRFPDPTAQGQLTVEMVEAQGIDPHSPSVLRVVEACLPASHGLLTPAKVAASLRNDGG